MNAWVGLCLLVALAVYAAVVILLPLALIFALNTLFGLNIEVNFTTWFAGAILFLIASNTRTFKFK